MSRSILWCYETEKVISHKDPHYQPTGYGKPVYLIYAADFDTYHCGTVEGKEILACRIILHNLL